MNDRPVENLRVHFYGTQGSGSVFPSRRERRDLRELMEYELLQAVFQDLEQFRDSNGRVSFDPEEVLGGPLKKNTLLDYRRKFQLPEPRVYGGWTTCVWVETADGHDIVLDCGSGFRNCAAHLQEKWADRPERHLHVFGSHSHLDHTEGFDQAAVCFDPRNTLHIYGNRQFLFALDGYLGIFSRQVKDEVRGVQTPIFYAMMPARFEARELVAAGSEGESGFGAQGQHDLATPLQLGKTTIQALEVYHPAPCLAYRIERNGKAFLFCTDHELRHGPDGDDPRQQASLEAEQRVVEFAQGVDLMYRDAQYLRVEYDGQQGIGNSGAVPRLDWGHSCIEDVRDMAEQCGVKHTLIGHHDPNRDWSERNWIDSMLSRGCAGTGRVIELARAETDFDL